MIKIVKLLLFLVFLIKKLYTFFIKTLLNAILSDAENRKKHFKYYTFLAERMVLNICIQNSLASVEHTTIRKIGILNKAK